ncbi:ABC transporter ATP-binding protein [Nocardia sp. NPDC052254]|uniref:ABC transporter ATP-binding protein n=1 Tax=Nocardia sp. NPDC052254 TaxID=3155681 RepID=UPI003436D8CC
MSDIALELRSITAGYGSTIVLHDIGLEFARGSVTALLGPNGAGKTTLLRVAAGLLPARSGGVVVHGRQMGRARPARRARAGLCLIPEQRGVFADLTVRENLRLMTPRRRAGRNSDADTVLDVFPALRSRLEQRAGALSGGQQQMLALGRAWLAEPSIVLLDEVSMGLAPVIVDEIFTALGELRRGGAAIVLVEQYIQHALAMADRVVILQRGRVTATGSATDFDRDDVLENYFGIEGGSTDLPATPAGHPPGARGRGMGVANHDSLQGAEDEEE